MTEVVEIPASNVSPPAVGSETVQKTQNLQTESEGVPVASSGLDVTRLIALGNVCLYCPAGSLPPCSCDEDPCHNSWNFHGILAFAVLGFPEFFGLLASWLHCPANQKSATAHHHPGWGLLEAARCWLGGSVGKGILGRSIMVASPNICSPLFQPPLCSCQKVWVEVTLLPCQSLNQSM